MYEFNAKNSSNSCDDCERYHTRTPKKTEEKKTKATLTRRGKIRLLTESNRTLDVLKSRYMTGVSAPCKKARPLAAPIAIFNLVPHAKDSEIPVIRNRTVQNMMPK